MAESAFAVNVPAAEPFVAQLRQRHDPSARLAVPAHVTLLYPFMPPERIDAEVLARVRAVLADFSAFDFRLAGMDRFPGVLFLKPEPAEPFAAMTRALWAAFPAWPPYAGQWDQIVPHLSVAQADEATLANVERELTASLPADQRIVTSCNEVVLNENSSGLWRPMHVFTLREPRQ